MSLIDHLCHLSIEAREVDLGSSIDRVHISELSSLQFLSEYVAKNKACIITGAMEDWPAMRLWDKRYLIEKGGEAQVTVDITPNGRADAVTWLAVHDNEDRVSGSLPSGSGEERLENWFVSPMETKSTLRSFYDELRESRRSNDRVLYLQHQNDSLNIEAPWLAEDIRPFPLSEVFGSQPEATNLWIGDERSATTFHKDHYENIYSVVQGRKIFSLLPPLDVWRMHIKEYPSGRWTRDDMGQWRAVREKDKVSVPWCPIPVGSSSPSPKTKSAYPHFYNPDLPKPLIAEVDQGEILYLPACWYHSVEQVPPEPGGVVIAVNSWFDMKFDTRWSYFQLVESLGKELAL